jgi:hypothetical protein
MFESRLSERKTNGNWVRTRQIFTNGDGRADGTKRHRSGRISRHNAGRDTAI